jgi:hypothetical protein
MSLLLKVVAEVIDPVMASFELGPCDMTVSGLQAHDCSDPTASHGSGTGPHRFGTSERKAGQTE